MLAHFVARGTTKRLSTTPCIGEVVVPPFTLSDWLRAPRHRQHKCRLRKRAVMHPDVWQAETCLKLVALSAVLLALAVVLSLTFPSTWPLLAARAALLGFGMAFLVVGLRRRRHRSSPP